MTPDKQAMTCSLVTVFISWKSNEKQGVIIWFVEEMSPENWLDVRNLMDNLNIILCSCGV